MANYNPDEARDKGKWTTGAAGEPWKPNPEDDKAFADALNAKHFKDAADEVAVKLKYDPAMISVTNTPRSFTVNGTNYNEGGHTTLADKKITLYQGPFWTKSSVQGITAHEIMHAKFETFRDDYLKEHALVMATMSSDNMKADGTLKGPDALKYPVYQAYTKAMMPDIANDFAKSDGITKYSEDYWKAWKDTTSNTVSTPIAFHETLAEMARLHFEQGKIVAPPGIKKSTSLDENGKPYLFLTSAYPSKSWTDLYNAVNDHWDSKHK